MKKSSLFVLSIVLLSVTGCAHDTVVVGYADPYPYPYPYSYNYLGPDFVWWGGGGHWHHH
jgi:hypothetical protein